jgi:hypothetical protein
MEEFFTPEYYFLFVYASRIYIRPVGGGRAV